MKNALPVVGVLMFVGLVIYFAWPFLLLAAFVYVLSQQGWP